MTDEDLRQRRLAIIKEHMDTEVTKEFDKTLAPTANAFSVPIIAVFFFEGDRIVNERIYFDSASLVTQIGRAELLPLATGA